MGFMDFKDSRNSDTADLKTRAPGSRQCASFAFVADMELPRGDP